MSKKNIEIKRSGKSGVLNVPDVGAFTFYTGADVESQWDTLILSETDVAWEQDSELVGGKRIVPYGSNNNLPVVIRDLMEGNNFAPGILEREIGLNYGQGPQLYVEVIEEGDLVRKWTYDEEIWNWLKSWNYERFIDMALVEFKHLKGVFVKRFLKRGMRIGRKPEFTLEVCPGTDARLAWVESRRLEDVDTIYTGDFENNCQKTGIKSWPVWNRFDPYANEASMSYHNMYSYAHSFYSIPGFWGSRKWIARSSDVPDVLKYMMDNAISAFYEIHSPAGYWTDKRNKLEERHAAKTEKEIDKLMTELEDETFQKIGKVLAGKKNVGKYVSFVDFYDEEIGEVVKWEIKAIDNKMKDLIDAQLKIKDSADSSTSSGVGLHPALSNIMMNGKSAAGSEMLYALKLYLASDTAIVERVVMEAINQCIALQFPQSKKRLGFYHKIVLREENVSVGERAVNNV